MNKKKKKKKKKDLISIYLLFNYYKLIINKIIENFIN